MDARLTLSSKTRKQISTIHQMLLWMQKNERHLKNTNIKGIVTAMSLSGDLEGYKSSYLAERINYMINHQMLYRYGGKRRATFRINYLHVNIPPDVLENAPKDVQLEVKRTIGGMKEGQYLDDVGCVVTPAAEKPKEETEAKPAKEESTTPVETPQEILVPIEAKQDGKTLKLTINITLKLN